MMKGIFFFIGSTLLVAVLHSCKSKNRIYKDDLIGVYKLDDVYFRDSSKMAARLVEGYQTWRLSLMENDNFEFTGHGKKIIGYWAFREGDDKKSRILFQSGYMSENIIFARFDKTKLLFEQPCSMLDSAFQQAIMKRIDK